MDACRSQSSVGGEAHCFVPPGSVKVIVVFGVASGVCNRENIGRGFGRLASFALHVPHGRYIEKRDKTVLK